MSGDQKLGAIVKELNAAFGALRANNVVLNSLPIHAWNATAKPANNEIGVEVLRDEALLLTSYAPELSSEMYWYEIILPVVARTLVVHQRLLKKGAAVRFTFKSESGANRFSCNALELASKADEISGPAGFGTMMAMMDPE